MTELWKLSATEVAAQVRNKQLKPSEAIGAAIERAEETNTHRNAITLPLYEQAMSTAVIADEQVAAGDELGPLHGVPVTIK